MLPTGGGAQPFHFQHTTTTILCCMCGTAIEANPSNMCVNCIRGQVDITDGIPKQLTCTFCRHCGRYLNPPNTWLYCEPESRELLTFCLKRIKGLKKVKLVDAGFIWTEPHSKRIKIKLTVQKEVFTSTILQQVFVVEFIVQNQQCPSCQSSFTEHTWSSVVQVRQKTDHKRTFYYLEQIILKHGLHLQTIKVKEQPDGLDFFFGHRSHASKFVDFLQAIVPIRYKCSEKLISSDLKSNTYNYNYTFSVEITPVCRDHLLCLPKKVAHAIGNISPLVLCYKVSNLMHVIDPNTLQVAELSAAAFWQQPFRPLASANQFTEYIVLDINPIGPTRGKFVLAEAQVARSRDFGSNDIIFFARTHLGHLLKPGDTAAGFDLTSTNFNESDLLGMQGREFPDVILVRKTYPNRRKKSRPRPWMLKSLEKEEQDGLRKTDAMKAEHDYEQFLRDLEEDPEYRSTVNLYKASNTKAGAGGMEVAEEEESDVGETDFPEPSISELIEDMTDMTI
ncbi:ribosome-binding protein [Balamuthia mandrillaris]